MSLHKLAGISPSHPGSLSCLLYFLCMLAIPIFPLFKFEEFLIYLYNVYACMLCTCIHVLCHTSAHVMEPCRGFSTSVLFIIIGQVGVSPLRCDTSVVWCSHTATVHVFLLTRHCNFSACASTMKPGHRLCTIRQKTSQYV